MQKKSYHHGDLRKALIENGVRLVTEGDAEKLSLREVARMAGVSATAVYHHFPDKQALLSALAQEGLARLATAQYRASEQAGGGKAGFAATGRAYVNFALENPALFKLIGSTHAPPLDKADDLPDPMAFLLANATALAPPGAPPIAAQAIAIQGWALAHGLALLMLEGHVPTDQKLIELVLNPNTFSDLPTAVRASGTTPAGTARKEPRPRAKKKR
jgi:AcrR family transcriptional regulator